MSHNSVGPNEIGNLHQRIAEVAGKYEQKIKDLFNFHSCSESAEVDRLKLICTQNEEQLSRQKSAIDQLSQKIAIVEIKIDSKVTLLARELENFKKYYDQCFQYTLRRQNEILDRTNSLSRQMQSQANLLSMSSPLEYIKYTNELLLSIAKGLDLKSQELNYRLHSELSGFEIELSKWIDHYEEAIQIEDQLKFIKYGNDTLRQCLEKSVQMIQELRQPDMRNAETARKVVNYFEPKFKQILKRINGYSVEIQMVRMMITRDTKTVNEIQKEEKEVMLQQINELKLTLERDKAQRVDREAIIAETQGRIFELQQCVNSLKRTQFHLRREISELKILNLEYSKQIQSLKLTASSKQPKHDQNYLMEAEHEKLLRKYHAQSATLESLISQLTKSGNTGASKSQRFLGSGQAEKHRDQYARSTSNPRKQSSTKSNKQKYHNLKSSLQESSEDEAERIGLLQSHEKLARQNKQLVKINKSLQEQIHNFITAKTNQSKQDSQYLDELELEIQQLSKANLDLSRKSNDLFNQNLRLTEQVQKLQSKSKQYRNAAAVLERKNQGLLVQNRQLIAELLEFQHGFENAEQKNSWIENHCPKSDTGYDPCETKMKVEKERKPRKISEFLMQLEGAIISSGLPIPIYCELDQNGYVIEQKTGNYLVDKNKRPMSLTEAELEAALETGLILI